MSVPKSGYQPLQTVPLSISQVRFCTEASIVAVCYSVLCRLLAELASETGGRGDIYMSVFLT
jgi:hypothetical protein